MQSACAASAWRCRCVCECTGAHPLSRRCTMPGRSTAAAPPAGASIGAASSPSSNPSSSSSASSAAASASSGKSAARGRDPVATRIAGSEQWCSTAFTSVPLCAPRNAGTRQRSMRVRVASSAARTAWPAEGCTTMCAALLTTSKWASSYTTCGALYGEPGRGVRGCGAQATRLERQRFGQRLHRRRRREHQQQRVASAHLRRAAREAAREMRSEARARAQRRQAGRAPAATAW